MRISDSVNESSMNFLTGSDRQQTQLLPATLEDYVSADNQVRFVDAFVDTLDLKAAGFCFPKENREGRGRPASPAFASIQSR